MRSLLVGVMVTLALAALVSPNRARACPLAGGLTHTIDSAMVGVDQTPPQLAQPTVSDVLKLDTGAGCTMKCGWGHTARLSNLATDDMSPVDRIGYRLRTVAGTPPGLPGWPDGGEAVDGAPDGSLTLFWNGDDDFDFTLQVVAVDQAGNPSAPQTVRIQDGMGGCRVGGRRGPGGPAPLVVALALASAAARRRRAALTRESPVGTARRPGSEPAPRAPVPTSPARRPAVPASPPRTC